MILWEGSLDISCCCIIPPYNSVQAQAVQSGLLGEKPRLLSPEDNVKLATVGG